MCTEVVTALIGVGGTLLGTILGWFLNVLANNGNLDISQDTVIHFSTLDELGCFIIVKDIEHADYFSMDINLEIYNKSSSMQPMRWAKLVFLNAENKIIHEVIPSAPDLRGNGVYAKFPEIGSINIPAKTVIQKTLDYKTNNTALDFDLLFQTRKVYLQYTNRKNRVKKIVILKDNLWQHYLKQWENEYNG